VTLAGDYSNAGKARGRGANETAVEIVRVKDVDLLVQQQPAQSFELPQCIRIIKAGQWKFGHSRKSSLYLLIERTLVAKRCKAHIVALGIESLQELDRLALGAADLEAGNEVKHSRAGARGLSDLRGAPGY
jgi:hypothetical protein